MKHLTDSTLSALDHASAKLTLFSSLLDKFVERVVPPVTASACGGSKCAYTTCTDVRCGHHMVGYYLYSNRPRGCEQGNITCRVQACFC